MHCARKIIDKLYWIGGSDRRLALFENAFPIPRGISYNAYLLKAEKTVLFDTVDQSVAGVFFEGLAHVLDGSPLDYVVVHHMEPDHAATLGELCMRHPETQIVCNAKSAQMIRQFFAADLESRFQLVAEGDVLSLGGHQLSFVMAPMVHWPEVMVSYEHTTGTLFSADAFGTFGALSGNLFADEVDFRHEWLPDARRYYSNIVGKYGVQVQALLKKAAGLDIRLLCPLHGPIWRKDIAWFVEKYQRWSSYTPEEQAAVIIYGSIYGHTENAAQLLAGKLAECGVRNIAMYDAANTHSSNLIAEAFRASHIALLSVTYNAGIFTPVENLLSAMAAHNVQSRTVALAQNGSWALSAEKGMRAWFEKMKNIQILEPVLTVHSALNPEQETEVEAMAAAIYASMQAAT